MVDQELGVVIVVSFRVSRGANPRGYAGGGNGNRSNIIEPCITLSMKLAKCFCLMFG